MLHEADELGAARLAGSSDSSTTADIAEILAAHQKPRRRRYSRSSCFERRSSRSASALEDLLVVRISASRAACRRRSSSTTLRRRRERADEQRAPRSGVAAAQRGCRVNRKAAPPQERFEARETSIFGGHEGACSLRFSDRFKDRVTLLEKNSRELTTRYRRSSIRGHAVRPRSARAHPPALGRGGPGVEKQTWGAGEDARLTALVAVHGVKAWKVVGEAIGGGRNGKQCRERWHNHLDPDVRKGPWSSEEDAVVLECHRSSATRGRRDRGAPAGPRTWRSRTASTRSRACGSRLSTAGATAGADDARAPAPGAGAGAGAGRREGARCGLPALSSLDEIEKDMLSRIVDDGDDDDWDDDDGGDDDDGRAAAARCRRTPLPPPSRPPTPSSGSRFRPPLAPPPPPFGPPLTVPVAPFPPAQPWVPPAPLAPPAAGASTRHGVGRRRAGGRRRRPRAGSVACRRRRRSSSGRAADRCASRWASTRTRS